MGRGRGRPPKYGTPARIVAITLPEEVVTELEHLDDDLGWAIVRLVEERKRARGKSGPRGKALSSKARRAGGAKPVAAAELVSVGSGQSLIVVNSATVRSIPGVQLIPLSDTEAFLAMEPGRGMADLEVAVLDRSEHLRAGSQGHDSIGHLLAKLRLWRRDERLSFQPRAIILVAEK